MSCQQLYIEQKIHILYTAKYMHVRFNFDNVSFEGGGGGHPKKMTVWGGGACEKMRTEWGGGHGNL